MLYSEQSRILKKIALSQNEDIKLLIETINETKGDADTLAQQLNLCLVLEQQQREEIEYLKNKDKNSYIYGNIITTVPGLMLMTYGFIEMGNGNTDKGWRFFEAGAVTLVGLELVYQGGHWLFRIW